MTSILSARILFMHFNDSQTPTSVPDTSDTMGQRHDDRSCVRHPFAVQIQYLRPRAIFPNADIRPQLNFSNSVRRVIVQYRERWTRMEEKLEK